MLKLKEINLGKRQQELNEAVSKTISKNVDFDSIKAQQEHSDVDRLYKIDVASAYRNLNYILDTFKSGDTLYISRALKKTWLYESTNASVINPDYLHHKIFPFMSIKMKKKMLTAISMHVHDETRASNFYTYCLSDVKLNKIALKFLNWTNEEHKNKYMCSTDNNIDNISYIVGNSFDLAEAYLANRKSKKRGTNNTVHEFRYLYNISNTKYLDLMENYTELCDVRFYAQKTPKLGLRISKDIMTKYKERVSQNPQLYFLKLNMSVIVRHSSVDDAKHYIKCLLPPEADEFWDMDFYNKYKQIIDKLPLCERYLFLCESFHSKYTNEPFLMSKEFYELNYYNLLTYEEREAWALAHLKENNELLGPDQDYIWYKFVNFELAFKEIKKNIIVAPCKNKRRELIKVLIESVKNETELEILLNYYYDRHVNENEDQKLLFIDNVIEQNNIFKFNETCWDIFTKLLRSTRIFTPECHYWDNKYKTLIIIYHIISNKPIPKDLDDYALTVYNARFIPNLRELHQKLSKEQINLIYQHLINLCINRLKHYDTQPHNEIIKSAREVIDTGLSLMQHFEKHKDECPDIILNFMKRDINFEHHEYISDLKNEPETKIGGKELMQLLKLDTKLFIEKLPKFSVQLSNSGYYIFQTRGFLIKLLKKIKIYFTNDVAIDVLSLCNQWLSEEEYENNLYAFIVMCVFLIGSEQYKVAFLSKHEPESPKISHDVIDKKLKSIQERICQFALYSRPPVPLQSILPYIKGDYLKFCLPIFDSYLANLPLPLCLNFVSTILDNPVSIQKHGLRLAFQSFSVEDLTNLINVVWKSTKNVSLRSTIYKSLHNKIISVDDKSQKELYELFKTLTLDLHENDEEAVFDLLKSFNLSHLKGDFLATAWNSVQKLSDQKSKNIKLKCDILEKITSEIESVDMEVCYNIIKAFARSMTINKNNEGNSRETETSKLIKAKWNLVTKYIVYNNNKEHFKNSLDLVDFIVNKCNEMIDVIEKDIYIYQKFLFWFVQRILHWSDCRCNKCTVPVLEHITELLCTSLPIPRIYSLYLELRLTILCINVLDTDGDIEYENKANELTTTLIEFLIGLKNKNMLYSAFYDTIGTLLCNSVDIICDKAGASGDALITLVSSHLLDVEMREAKLMAVIILPTQCPETYAKIWKSVIKKIQSSDDDELKTYIYEHFMNVNFNKIL